MPGMLVELGVFSELVLVGHVNPLFGDSDHCMLVPRDTLAVRDKQVWSPDA